MSIQTEEVVLGALRRRAERTIPRQFTNAELVKLAISAALRDPMDAYNVLFGYRIAKELQHGQSSKDEPLAISPEEFATLFGRTVKETGRIKTAFATQREMCEKIAKGAATTLMSALAAEAWAYMTVRLAACVAMRTERSLDMLQALVGTLVRSDLRRLQTLIDDIQDEEDRDDSHLLPLCGAIEALAETVSA